MRNPSPVSVSRLYHREEEWALDWAQYRHRLVCLHNLDGTRRAVEHPIATAASIIKNVPMPMPGGSMSGRQGGQTSFSWKKGREGDVNKSCVHFLCPSNKFPCPWAYEQSLKNSGEKRERIHNFANIFSTSGNFLRLNIPFSFDLWHFQRHASTPWP